MQNIHKTITAADSSSKYYTMRLEYITNMGISHFWHQMWGWLYSNTYFVWLLWV